MNPIQLERHRDQATRLRLLKIRERLDALLQDAAAKDLSYADFLDQVLCEEVAAKAAKKITMRTSLARFPFVKSLEAFDSPTSPRWIKSRSSSWPPATSSSTARIL
ncbi:MAG: ATP-binding protein [Nitrospira sp.]